MFAMLAPISINLKKSAEVYTRVAGCLPGDPMVRFTLRDGRRAASIRMEMPESEKIEELRETVEEYWGDGRVLLVRDYMVLDPEKNIGDSVDENDVIDVIPYMGTKISAR
jgi:hypothetical protein